MSCVLRTFEAYWGDSPAKEKTKKCDEKSGHNYDIFLRYQERKQHSPGCANPRQHDKVDHVCVPMSKWVADVERKKRSSHCLKGVNYCHDEADSPKIGIHAVSTCCIAKELCPVHCDCFGGNNPHNHSKNSSNFCCIPTGKGTGFIESTVGTKMRTADRECNGKRRHKHLRFNIALYSV